MSRSPILLERSATPETTAYKWLRHPIFAWLGIRPVWGQHTAGEHAALKKWATGKSSIVEIGVAEGASAVALREVMLPLVPFG